MASRRPGDTGGCRGLTLTLRGRTSQRRRIVSWGLADMHASMTLESMTRARYPHGSQGYNTLSSIMVMNLILKIEIQCRTFCKTSFVPCRSRIRHPGSYPCPVHRPLKVPYLKRLQNNPAAPRHFRSARYRSATGCGPPVCDSCLLLFVVLSVCRSVSVSEIH